MPPTNISKIPKFLKRLYRETSDPENKYIMWNTNGEHIIIMNKEAFLRNTLPVISKTKEYSTFVRQLNMYGFVKVKNEKSDESEEYMHPYFKREQPGLMELVRRVSKSSKAETQLNWNTLENTITYLTNNNYRLGNEIEIMKERLDKQDQTINGLMDILGRVFRTGLQNINIDPQYNKQNMDMLFKYPPLAGNENERRDSRMLKNLPSKSTLEDDKEESKEEKMFPDMNDIFF